MTDPLAREWLGTYRRLQAQLNQSVASIFGRTGVVIATLGDYAASLISNDSSVAGSTVKDALNTLLADLVASAVANDSSVTGTTVKDALNTLSSSSAGGGFATYGDGSDGTVTFDGTTTILGLIPAANIYTLNRDLFLANATINNNVTIKPNGFRILCSGTITGGGANALIKWNGNDAAGATGGAAINVSGSLSTSFGGSGAAGGTSVGATGFSPSSSWGGSGGHGGAGTSGAGGGGGVPSHASPIYGQPRSLPHLATFGQVTGVVISGGAGGGSGSGDGTNSGGGGGGGGCVIVVYAKAFAGTGGIQARGGVGGNATAGNCGGGGGGGGGSVHIISGSISGGAISGWSVDANGGSHGTSTGTGGGAITDGAAGQLILLTT